MNKYLVKERQLYGGPQKLYKFPNGYGASIVNHQYSHGLELAVIKWNKYSFDLCYDTPITSDVIGNLDPEEVEGILKQIFELESRGTVKWIIGLY